MYMRIVITAQVHSPELASQYTSIHYYTPCVINTPHIAISSKNTYLTYVGAIAISWKVYFNLKGYRLKIIRNLNEHDSHNNASEWSHFERS